MDFEFYYIIQSHPSGEEQLKSFSNQRKNKTRQHSYDISREEKNAFIHFN